MGKTKIILVGGFLGAGKTSMLREAARLLTERGLKTGLITNDQADGLVDTAVLVNDGNVVKEVSGSCFCCNFSGFIGAAEQIAKEIKEGIILAEPVGSCTDLSATIMQPLKDRYADFAETAPLTVMADPERLKGILDEKYSAAAYIIRKQFDEADIILINKTDLLSEEEAGELKKRAQERWPKARVMTVSVLAKNGIGDWLDAVLNADGAGNNMAEVDYDIYADGEAAYGWLNAEYYFEGISGDPKEKAKAFLKGIDDALRANEMNVGHVKFILQCENGRYMGNITGGLEEAALRCEESTGGETFLTVNARAETGPLKLQKTVLSVLEEVFAEDSCTKTMIKSLIPGRPNPTYRYDRVV